MRAKDYYAAKTGSVAFKIATVKNGYNGATIELYFHLKEDGSVVASYDGGFFSYADSVEEAEKRIEWTKLEVAA